MRSYKNCLLFTGLLFTELQELVVHLENNTPMQASTLLMVDPQDTKLQH